MRLIFVADDIESIGGIQTAMHTLAQHLARRGHHVRVVGMYRNSTRAPLPDCPVYQRSLLDAPLPGTPTDPIRMQAAKQRMGGILTAAGTGVLVMASVHASLWMQDVDTTGFALVGHYHGSYEYARTHYHLGVITDLWTTFAASVFLSHDDATAFAAHGCRNATWIPNPLPAAIAPVSIPATAVPRLRVLAVGRLEPIKRFDVAITAFSETALPGWQLHVIGSGSQEAELRTTAEHHRAGTGTRPEVVFRGRLPFTAMHAEYAVADLLLLTSDHEGFGMVIAEAAAAGTPTIAFDVSGGVRSLILHQVTGLLVPAGDVPALTRALRTLMTDTAQRRRLGHAARTAAAGLQPDTIAEHWEQLGAGLHRTHRQEARS